MKKFQRLGALLFSYIPLIPMLRQTRLYSW